MDSNKMTLPDFQESLAQLQKVAQGNRVPEWYKGDTRTAAQALVEFERIVGSIPAAVTSRAENVGELMAAAEKAWFESWQAFLDLRIDIHERNHAKLSNIGAARYVLFCADLARLVGNAQTAISRAKVWAGDDPEYGRAPLVSKAAYAVDLEWRRFKEIEAKPMAVATVFSQDLAKRLVALRMPSIQQMLELDAVRLERTGLHPLEIAEIEAKIGTPAGGKREDHHTTTLADARGARQATQHVNGFSRSDPALSQIKQALEELEARQSCGDLVFFYEPMRRAMQSARNTLTHVGNLETDAAFRARLSEAIGVMRVAIETYERAMSEGVPAFWLVRDSVWGRFAPLKKERPTWDALLPMDEPTVRAMLEKCETGEGAEGRIAKALEMVMGMLAFARHAEEIKLGLLEAVTLTPDDLTERGLTLAEIAIVEARKAKKAEAVAFASGTKIAIARLDAPVVSGNGGDPAHIADEPEHIVAEVQAPVRDTKAAKNPKRVAKAKGKAESRAREEGEDKSPKTVRARRSHAAAVAE